MNNFSYLIMDAKTFPLCSCVPRLPCSSILCIIAHKMSSRIALVKTVNSFNDRFMPIHSRIYHSLIITVTWLAFKTQRGISNDWYIYLSFELPMSDTIFSGWCFMSILSQIQSPSQPQAPPNHVLFISGYLSTPIHSIHEHIQIHQQIYATHNNNPFTL